MAERLDHDLSNKDIELLSESLMLQYKKNILVFLVKIGHLLEMS